MSPEQPCTAAGMGRKAEPSAAEKLPMVSETLVMGWLNE